MIATITVYIPLATVNICFQDESRFGQQNTTTKLWAPKGYRPRAVKQQQFEYAYLFGEASPSNGGNRSFGHSLSHTQDLKNIIVGAFIKIDVANRII
jgi:hypothetical protein